MVAVLLFGVTGNTGKHVLAKAIERGDNVTVYVRNKSKIHADHLKKISVVEGDLTDLAKVKKAVVDSRPDAIIVTSSLPIKSPITPLNSDAVPAMVEGLKESNRIGECRFIYLSGGFAVPPGEELPFSLWILSFLIPVIGLTGMVHDNRLVTNYLYSTPPELKFSVLRMGLVVEAPDKGQVKPNGSGKVTFADVSDFLLRLGRDNSDPVTLRKAFLIGY